MSAVDTWKSEIARSLGRWRMRRSQVANCENRGNRVGTGDQRALGSKLVHKRPHEFRMFRKHSPQVSKGAVQVESAFNASGVGGASLKPCPLNVCMHG